MVLSTKQGGEQIAATLPRVRARHHEPTQGGDCHGQNGEDEFHNKRAEVDFHFHRLPLEAPVADEDGTDKDVEEERGRHPIASPEDELPLVEEQADEPHAYGAERGSDPRDVPGVGVCRQQELTEEKGKEWEVDMEGGGGKGRTERDR